MDYKYHGIITSKHDIAEVDRIYHIYTKEVGKIRVLGKGVRNAGAKLAGQLEPITYGEIFVARSRGMGKITGAITINIFSNIKNNLVSLEKVFYIFRILEKIISEQEKDEQVFDLLLSYLDILDGFSSEFPNEEKKDILTFGFLFKFLDVSGYKIGVEKCMMCGEKLKDQANYFESEQGGFLCLSCRNRIGKGIKSTPGAIKLVRIFLKNDVKNFSKISAPKEDVRNIKIVCEEMIRWIG